MPSENKVPSTPSCSHQQESSPSLTPRHRNSPPVKTSPTRLPAAYDGEDGDDDSGVDDLLANPYFVQDDYDDRSSVSGLTMVTSAKNHRIPQDSEPRSRESFLRKEHDAIRQMMLQEVDNEEEYSEAYPNEIGSTTTVAVDQAQDMAQQMRIMLDEFNLNNPASDESDHEIMGAIKAAPKKETASPRVHMDNPKEHRVSYYDERIATSNMTPEDGDVVSNGDSTSISEQTNTEVALSHHQVVPKSRSEQYRSKYATYRRQLRKARRRRVMVRMAVTAILTLILVAVGYYEFEYVSTFMLRKQEAATPPPTPPLPVTKRPRRSIVDRLHQRQRQRQRLQQQQAKETAAAAALAEHYHHPWLCNGPLADLLFHDWCHRLASKIPSMIGMRLLKQSCSSKVDTMIPLLCAVQQDDVIVLVGLLLPLSRRTMMRKESQSWF